MKAFHRIWLSAIAVLVAASTAMAQPVVIPAIHDPWLNWDIFNRTGQLVNDLHIIVENPNYIPPEVFQGPFATFAVTPNAGGTLLSWSNPIGGPIPDGGIAHIGAYMLGSGRIVDAYFTLDGVKVGPSIPIIYELTRVIPNPGDPTLGDISMLLGTTDAAMGQLGPAQSWLMSGVRTWMDIPAGDLGLPDINPVLDLNGDPRLLGRETVPSQTEFAIDSFFDVWTEIAVGTTPNTGPEFESLLYSEVSLLDDSGSQPVVIPYVRFWNLNPQSPEPASLVLLGVGGVLVLSRRRSRS